MLVSTLATQDLMGSTVPLTVFAGAVAFELRDLRPGAMMICADSWWLGHGNKTTTLEIDI